MPKPTKPDATDAPASQADMHTEIDVRVLQACCYGVPNTVATISAAELAAAKADGLVDDDPAAVEYTRGAAQAE
jgi:hypothetical protein